MLGHAIKSSFAFDQDIVNLNHGSAGTVAKPVLEAQLEAIHRRAAFPDNYYRPLIHGQQLRAKEREIIAGVIDSDPDCTFFAQNTSVASSTILRSFPFAKGDKIVYPDTTYHSLKLTLEFVARTTGAELVEFKVDFPISEQDFLAQFEKVLESEKPRLAVYDTVSSTPAVYFPWEKMTAMCHKLGVLSFVDGAHGIGLIKLSLNTVKPTFFASNIHKWYWTAQGLAVVYVDKSQHNNVQGMPISNVGINDFGPDRLARIFAFAATHDYTAIDSVAAAFKFRSELGEDAIIAYHTKLAQDAAALVCKKWGTPELGIPGRRVAMFNVLCPYQPKNIYEFSVETMQRLRDKHRASVAIFGYRGQAWVRFSTAAFVELEDFEYVLSALEECFEAYSD